VTAIREFIPHLVSVENREKRAALLVLDSMGYSDFVVKFSSVDQTEGSKQAGDVVLSRSEVTEDMPVVTRSEGQSKALGWVYLGDWDRKTRRWIAHHFHGIDNPAADVAGTTISVREATHSVNVRKAPPNMFGKLSDATSVLYSGTPVRIVEVDEWMNSGYMWARVEG
jgi:hypothetical protein